MSELSALNPVSEPVTLSTGRAVNVEPLRTRQFFKLLRIVTHGAGAAFGSTRLDPNDDGFIEQLLVLVLMSIPDAENETIDFLQSMTSPVGLREGRDLNKQDSERNQELWRRYQADMDNPALDDLLTLVETIVRREAADLQALGKRLAAMFSLAQRTGQLSADRTSTTSPGVSSSERSPVPSTSYPASTDGMTPQSPTFPYDGSVRS